MLLWDYEMRPERELLGGLSLPQRLSVAVSALEWTLGTLEEPIATGTVQSYLESGLMAAREAVAAGGVRLVLPDEMLDQFDDVEEQADEPGTSHFLTALMVCHDSEDGLGVEQLFGVLSYCYEGSLDRVGLDEWTPERERQVQRCLDVIAFQKRLIQESLAAG